MIRLFTTSPLAAGGGVIPQPEQARYLTQVMRREVGDEVLLFNGRDGEWRARLADVSKRGCRLELVEQTRPQAMGLDGTTSLYYYGSSLGGGRIDDAVRARYSRRGDRFWLLGYTLLFLGPSVILFSVGLLVVGAAWFALWLVYVFFVIRYFPRVHTTPKT